MYMENLKRTIEKGNLQFRMIFIILALIPLIFLNDFYIHIYYHLFGTLLLHTITQQWHIVVLNIVLFLIFLIPLSFRRRINWKEYGVVTAFFVSLFIEMYGIPLTVFFASKYFSGSASELPNMVIVFKFLGVNIGMTMAMVYGTVLMIMGMLLIIIGWITLYKNLKKDEIVTKGIYSYSRHPQYFGFILIILGWLVGWPTLLTVIFAPILIFMYLRVCKIEEKELSDIKEYEEYKERVPFFI